MTASSRRWPAIREQLNAVKAENPDRLYVLSVIVPPERRDELEADGWVVHEDPTRAVTAIDAMGRFGAAFAAPDPAIRAELSRAVTLPDGDAVRGRGKAPAGGGGHRVRAGSSACDSARRPWPRRNGSASRW